MITMQVTGGYCDYWRLLEVVGRLLEDVEGYWMLLDVTGGYGIFMKVTGGYLMLLEDTEVL